MLTAPEVIRAPAGERPANGHGRAPEIRWVNPLEHPAWDQELRQFQDAIFFHTSAWARVLTETYGFKPMSLMVHEENQVGAILPGMELHGFPKGPRAVSLPFTDHTAPLLRNATQARLLLEAVKTCGRMRGWRTWECRGGHPCWPESPASLSFYRHTLDLTVGEAELYSGFEPSVRRALRKAAGHRLEVRVEDSPEAMDAYFALHCRTRRRHGLPPQPKAFFESIHRHVIARGHGHVFLVRYRGCPIAGGVFFHWNRGVIFKFGASDTRHQVLRPNNLLMWYAIAHYAGRDYERLDLGRTSLSQEGLRRFKLGLGSTETRLDYLKYDLRQDAFVTDGGDLTHGWHNAFFRLLPLTVLRAFGTVLYRHLA
ncbi:MAG: GNAT family N-acetyltransferase [Verrucomicrobiales bacterium]|nr:GNAT family N-acetyltransferase [Verrucomicrobiales bacterium]